MANSGVGADIKVLLIEIGWVPVDYDNRISSHRLRSGALHYSASIREAQTSSAPQRLLFTKLPLKCGLSSLLPANGCWKPYLEVYLKAMSRSVLLSTSMMRPLRGLFVALGLAFTASLAFAASSGPLVVDGNSHVIVMEYEAWFGPQAATFQGSSAMPLLQSADMQAVGGG